MIELVNKDIKITIIYLHAQESTGKNEHDKERHV